MKRLIMLLLCAVLLSLEDRPEGRSLHFPGRRPQRCAHRIPYATREAGVESLCLLLRKIPLTREAFPDRWGQRSLRTSFQVLSS